ncbi:hypothetical protein EGW03_02660 [bacterium]|nr:hypothetical protein [bacterium]
MISSITTFKANHEQATMIAPLKILFTYSLLKNSYLHILLITPKNPSNRSKTPLHIAHKALLRISVYQCCLTGVTAKTCKIHEHLLIFFF